MKIKPLTHLSNNFHKVISRVINTCAPRKPHILNERVCYMKSVLEGQETITQEAFSEHLLNYGSGQVHGNNFCFIEPKDTTWAIKYSFVFCELISN